MAFVNGSFETIGSIDGQALGWTIAFDTGAQDVATFEGTILPFDAFEAGWAGGNQLSLTEFAAADLLSAEFNDNLLASVEAFDYEWKRPNRVVQLTMSQSGRSPAISGDLANFFTIGETYRDRSTGGRAVASEKISADIMEFIFTDFVHAIENQGEGFANGGPAGDDNVLAELHFGERIVGTGDGHTRAFLYTLIDIPIHAKANNLKSTISVSAIFGGVTQTSTDDGSGNIIGGNIKTDGINTIAYTSGDVALHFLTAPDVDTEVVISFEYGAAATDRQSETSSPVPFISNVAFLESSSSEIQPYNHSALTRFFPEDLIEMYDQVALVTKPEDFEANWDSNEDAITEFAEVNLTVGTFAPDAYEFDGFENTWSGANEDSQTAFSTSDVSAATFDVALTLFENFEDEWTTLLQI